jgi:flagellar biogenesis protein FliO
MDIALVFRSLYALLVIGVLLGGLWYFSRLQGRSRITGGPGKRLITVLETAFLSQHTTVHVVKVGSRYLLVGGGSQSPALLAELSEAEVQPWLDEQRRILTDQTVTLGDILKRLRGS